MSINDGASFEATALTVSNFSATGIEARGLDALLTLSNCNLLEASSESSIESSVHRGARAVLVHEHAKAVLTDLSIENAWAGVWVASQARVHASACMIGPCERYGAFAEGGSRVVLHASQIAGITCGDGMHVTGTGTVATGDHCQLERASAAGASARDGARLKLKYCQAEVNASHGFLAKRGAAIKAVSCESNSDGVGVCADSGAHVTAVNLTVLNGRGSGIVATGGSVMKLLEASVAGCDAGSGVEVRDAHTDLEMWGGSVSHRCATPHVASFVHAELRSCSEATLETEGEQEHTCTASGCSVMYIVRKCSQMDGACRTSNAAVEVTAAGTAKMQGVAVTSATGPAFKTTGAKSRLHLVSCSGTVAPHGEGAPFSHNDTGSQMEAPQKGAGDGSRDSARVYVKARGGQIRTVDCQPEINPKPKVCVCCHASITTGQPWAL